MSQQSQLWVEIFCLNFGRINIDIHKREDIYYWSSSIVVNFQKFRVFQKMASQTQMNHEDEAPLTNYVVLSEEHINEVNMINFQNQNS